MYKNKEWLKGKVRDIARQVGDEYLYINIQTVLELIDQLDEPEVLSQELPVISEYIVELIKRAFDLGTTSKTIEALTGMTIEQVAEKIIDGKLVPEQELPVIPKYVADWMEENSTGRCAWWKKIAEWEGEVPDKDRKVYDWYTQSNEDTFIIAWITRHYEVEEEPLYYVMKDGVVILSKRYRDYESHESHWIGTVTNKEYIKENPDKVRFTEQEIKDYDERFWAFAVPVDGGENECY